MKILSPIDKLSEVSALIDAGADELYGGYVSRRWRAKYSMLGSINHRYFPSAQIEGERELRGIIDAAHKKGARFYLTLNAPFYTGPQYDDLIEEARRLLGMGVDAFIVSDLGLIVRMRDDMPGADVHLSTLGTIFNGMSVKVFQGLGIKRMVLPRELTVPEMSGVIKQNPGVSFDAFILIGKCPNIEGFCGFTHNSPDLVWPCEESYRMEVVRGDEGARRIIGAQAGWSRVNRRQACGLCQVPMLKKAGVSALKIVGRGGPTAMKIKAVSAVKGIIGMAGDAGSETDARRASKHIYRELFGKECNPYVCYFPSS
jgi:putative protease